MHPTPAAIWAVAVGAIIDCAMAAAQNPAARRRAIVRRAVPAPRGPFRWREPAEESIEDDDPPPVVIAKCERAGEVWQVSAYFADHLQADRLFLMAGIAESPRAAAVAAIAEGGALKPRRF